jgi:hypothetical protein
VKWRSGSIIAAPDSGTFAGLVREFAHRVQKIDVVAASSWIRSSCWQGRQLQPVAANQTADDRQVLFCSMSQESFFAYGRPRVNVMTWRSSH